MSQGSLQYTAATPSPAAAAVNTANNGLSKNPAATVVLGQNVGEVGSPASLLNNREIPLAGFILNILGNDFGPGAEQFIFQSGGLEIVGDPANNPLIFAPSLTLTAAGTGQQAFITLSTDGVDPELWTIFSNNQGNIKIHELTGQVTVTMNFAEQVSAAEIFFNVTGNSRLNGFTYTKRKVFANNAVLPIGVQQDADRSIYTNKTAGADAAFNLPPVGDGQEFIFIVEDSFFMNVTPVVTDQIIFGAVVGAVGAAITSNSPGSVLHLISCQGRWFVLSAVGTWNL